MNAIEAFFASMGIYTVGLVPLIVMTYMGLHQHAEVDIDSWWTLPRYNNALQELTTHANSHDGGCGVCEGDPGYYCYIGDSDTFVPLSVDTCLPNANVNAFKPDACDILFLSCGYHKYVLPLASVFLAAVAFSCCGKDTYDRSIQIASYVSIFSFIVCFGSMTEWFSEPDDYCVEEICEEVLPEKDNYFIEAASCGYCLLVMFNATLNLTNLPDVPVLPHGSIDEYDAAFWGCFAWAAVVTTSTILAAVPNARVAIQRYLGRAVDAIGHARQHCSESAASLMARTGALAGSLREHVGRTGAMDVEDGRRLLEQPAVQMQSISYGATSED